PPSPPRDLLYTLKQSTLILEWASPSDTGGRSDVSYSVSCQRCVFGPRYHCEPCSANVGFVPQQSGLSGRTVTVLNLLPNINYTFSVEARNGVSDLLPNKRFYTHINISTSLPVVLSDDDINKENLTFLYLQRFQPEGFRWPWSSRGLNTARERELGGGRDMRRRKGQTGL
ncbi:ephrin type-A receptor 7-like isoform X1, partial [Tachysurus ichikawai]